MLTVLFIVTYFFQDSLYQVALNEIQLGNYASADVILRQKKQANWVSLRLQNIFENHFDQKKFRSFVLEDTEKVPSKREVISNVFELLVSNYSVQALFDYHHYMYLDKLPPLSKLQKRKKNIYNRLKDYGTRFKDDQVIYYLYDLNRKKQQYKEAHYWFFKLSKRKRNVLKLEKVELETKFFTDISRAEEQLFQLLQKTNDPIEKNKIYYYLTTVLLREKDEERARYYFELLDKNLMDPFELFILEHQIRQTNPPDLISTVKLFPEEMSVLKEINFRLQTLNSREGVLFLEALQKKNKSIICKLHINYLLYTSYKKMAFSRKRNKKMSEYSDTCYKLLDKIYHL